MLAPGGQLLPPAYSGRDGRGVYRAPEGKPGDARHSHSLTFGWGGRLRRDVDPQRRDARHVRTLQES